MKTLIKKLGFILYQDLLANLVLLLNSNYMYYVLITIFTTVFLLHIYIIYIHII